MHPPALGHTGRVTADRRRQSVDGSGTGKAASQLQHGSEQPDRLPQRQTVNLLAHEAE